MFAACSTRGASGVPGVCSTWGAEGAQLRSGWHGTRGMFVVSHVLHSRRYPPCRERSRPMLGLIDAVCLAASCVPCPRCARPQGPPLGWIPAPGAGLWGLHWDFPAASSKLLLPAVDPVRPLPLHHPPKGRGSPGLGSQPLRPAAWGSRQGAPAAHAIGGAVALRLWF